jgi:molybdopterin converting factor small subunit
VLKLTVGLYCGVARRLGKETEVVLEIPDGATFRDVSAALAARFPAFLGPLIAPATLELVEPHYYTVNGRRVTSPGEKVKEGDRILLMALTAGG